MTGQQGTKPVVVVGVDGSHQSQAALQWAARYAASIGGELRAVIAWQQDAGFGFFPQGPRGLDKEARQTLGRSVVSALGAESAANVEMRIVKGNPTSVLVAESSDADILVVGDRGYGGFAGLLLGSVGENCVRHAKCSVVVVRNA